MKKSIIVTMLLVVFASVSYGGVFDFFKKDSGKDKVKIGMAIDDLSLERWQKDRDFFKAEAEKLGADVIVTSANGNAQKQLKDAENLLSQGVDVLVIIPTNGDVIAPIVKEAHRSDVKVLAYDRLITNADVDNYISFDNVRVGELQAGALVEKKPKGKYFLMGGSPTDNNARLFRKGQMNILQPLIDKGDIEIVGDQWVKGWSAEEALKIMENALTANNNDIDVVVASNDSTAGGAIQALNAQGLAGKVLISGQDATLAGCRRILKGTQTMTIYKPIKELAKSAANLAVDMAKGIEITTNNTVNNGQKEVPSILLDPISVDKSNLKETVIRDGYHSEEEIYNF